MSKEEKNKINQVIVKNFPQEVKVKRNWMNIVIDIAVIFALIVSLISLNISISSYKLYYDEINKQPDLRISLLSPTDIVQNKINFRFNNSKYSSKEEVVVWLNNNGKRETGRVKLILFFRSNTKASVDTKDWEIPYQDRQYFQYENLDLMIYPEEIGYDVGRVKISIPKSKGNDTLFIGGYVVSGINLPMTSGRFIYNYNTQKFTTEKISGSPEWVNDLRETLVFSGE